MPVDQKPIAIKEKKSGPYTLGHLTLNRPHVINSLNLEMVQSLRQQLEQWHARHDLVAVFLDGCGEKGFCAGGDVKSVALQLTQNSLDLAKHFFSQEYQLNQLIADFSKPIICWGNGVVMGGGMGLWTNSKFKVATETSLFAMPELTIGFFPDVGASFYLHRFKEKIGWWLGLTASRLTGPQALTWGLTDLLIPNEHKKNLESTLLERPWSECSQSNHQQVYQALKSFSKPCEVPSSQRPSETLLRDLVASPSFADFWEQLERLSHKSPWFAQGYRQAQKGSPLSLRLTWQILKSSALWSRREATCREWDIAVNLCEGSDFYEGVRALLIDKDRAPNWSCKNPLDIPQENIQKYLRSRDDNPFKRPSN